MLTLPYDKKIPGYRSAAQKFRDWDEEHLFLPVGYYRNSEGLPNVRPIHHNKEHNKDDAIPVPNSLPNNQPSTDPPKDDTRNTSRYNTTVNSIPS